jgi:hypothetical protein
MFSDCGKFQILLMYTSEENIGIGFITPGKLTCFASILRHQNRPHQRGRTTFSVQYSGLLQFLFECGEWTVPQNAPPSDFHFHSTAYRDLLQNMIYLRIDNNKSLYALILGWTDNISMTCACVYHSELLGFCVHVCIYYICKLL